MTQVNQTNDALRNAFLQSTVTEDTSFAVKAEDLSNGSSIDFKKHFFEPQVGKTYTIKFLPNPGADPIIHRSAYKDLPDPERKGKTFHYVSSGNAKTCKALELFFELNQLKTAGDAVAEKKIDKYLSRTNQAACKIEILSSPDIEEIGTVRIFSFSTFGVNASVANLVNKKLNPTAEQVKQGFEKEDIFDIFESSVMNLVCTENEYPVAGGPARKGRDFSKSDWLPKKRGAYIKMSDGTEHTFTKADLVGGAIAPGAEKAFNEFVSLVLNEDYDIYNYFAYKTVDDPRNSKDTNDYLKSVFAKVDEITEVIRTKSLAEIANYGKKEAKPAGEADANGKVNGAKNILADSVPTELQDSVLNAGAETVQTKSDASDLASSILND